MASGIKVEPSENRAGHPPWSGVLGGQGPPKEVPWRGLCLPRGGLREGAACMRQCRMQLEPAELGLTVTVIYWFGGPEKTPPFLQQLVRMSIVLC